jgi:ubiquinone/menaquinone biosynthesis C-methylase UbiE
LYLSTHTEVIIADGTHEATLNEVMRVVKPSGRLAVIEFKKMPGPPGPPEKVRLSPEALDQVLAPRRLQCQRTVELGTVTYLSLFSRDK